MFDSAAENYSRLVPRVHDLESQGLHSNPIQFYDFLQNRVMILFRPKFEEPDQDRPEFSLVLSKKQTYDAVGLILSRGTLLRIDSMHSQFRWPRKWQKRCDMIPSC